MEAAEVILKQISADVLAKQIEKTLLSVKGSGYKHSELSGGWLMEAQSRAGPEGAYLSLPCLFKLYQLFCSVNYEEALSVWLGEMIEITFYVPSSNSSTCFQRRTTFCRM